MMLSILISWKRKYKVMELKKQSEITYIKETVQYSDSEEFKKDYFVRIKDGWIINEPHYINSLTFTYKKLKAENVIKCDDFL
jgi:hypothetical protein